MSANKILVLLSDFGLSEHFVACMKGVALNVDSELVVHDLTHKIEPFNIWQAAQILADTISYWPTGTVFVSVIDPGVGTQRRSVVANTSLGHYIVSPDNGTLTLVAEQPGIEQVREIDERSNRLPISEASHTFHGRDVYAYTGARLASGVISFDQVGPLTETDIVKLPHRPAQKLDNETIVGTLTKIERPFGNLVTNIPKALFDEFKLSTDGYSSVEVRITDDQKSVFREDLPYVKSFGHVSDGQALVYVDSSKRLGLAVNGGNFSELYGVKAGTNWQINVKKIRS